MTEFVCIILMNITLILLTIKIFNVYDILNKKLLKQKYEIENIINNKCLDIQIKYEKDMLNFINEIEYVLINKKVKTKKKK